jgi:hypothetical protein
MRHRFVSGTDGACQKNIIAMPAKGLRHGFCIAEPHEELGVSLPESKCALQVPAESGDFNGLIHEGALDTQ